MGAAPSRVALCALLILLCAGTAAQAQTESFSPRQIKLLIGFSPTGYGYDTYGRLLARHLGKYLPGNPAILPQNRPGAGSLNLANYIYNAAPRDGSEIAIVGRGVAMEPLIGAATSHGMLDSRKLVWLGSMNNEVSGFFVRQGAPASSLKEILAGVPLQVGSTGAAGDQQAFTSRSIPCSAPGSSRLPAIPGHRRSCSRSSVASSTASLDIPGALRALEAARRWPQAGSRS